MRCDMWTKFRHKVAFAFLRPIFRVYLRLKYGFRTKKYRLEKGPYLLLFNHPTNLDPLMMALSFKGPIYFMTNDDLFNIPFVSPLIRYLVAPIPKAKAVKDINAVKNCIRVAREGGKIGISPEGNRNYSGHLNYIDKAIVKLIKLLKVPVILYNIKGGFGVNPRFSRVIRKGKMSGEVNRILSASEIKEYSEDEIYTILIKALDVNDVELGYKYKGKALAENLESAFYTCPVCNDLRKIESKGNFFGCMECGFQAEYTEDLVFRTKDKRFKFKTVSEYYAFQEAFIRNADVMKISFQDQGVILNQIISHRRKKLIEGSLSFNHKQMVISDEENEKIINFKEITSLAIVYQNTLIINVENGSYQVLGNASFNALKYVHLFNQIKNFEKGVNDGFLGI